MIYYGLNQSDLRLKKSNLQHRKIKNIKKNFLICCIARHVKQKSLDFLIKGFYEFRKKNINSKLILVGNGPETKNSKCYQMI